MWSTAVKFTAHFYSIWDTVTVNSHVTYRVNLEFFTVDHADKVHYLITIHFHVMDVS